jgi:hypothetical protein
LLYCCVLRYRVGAYGDGNGLSPNRLDSQVHAHMSRNLRAIEQEQLLLQENPGLLRLYVRLTSCSSRLNLSRTYSMASLRALPVKQSGTLSRAVSLPCNQQLSLLRKIKSYMPQINTRNKNVNSADNI